MLECAAPDVNSRPNLYCKSFVYYSVSTVVVVSLQGFITRAVMACYARICDMEWVRIVLGINLSQPCLVLDPPILFGPQHSYHTRCKDSFATVTA